MVIVFFTLLIFKEKRRNKQTTKPRFSHRAGSRTRPVSTGTHCYRSAITTLCTPVNCYQTAVKCQEVIRISILPESYRQQAEKVNDREERDLQRRGSVRLSAAPTEVSFSATLHSYSFRSALPQPPGRAGIGRRSLRNGPFPAGGPRDTHPRSDRKPRPSPSAAPLTLRFASARPDRGSRPPPATFECAGPGGLARAGSGVTERRDRDGPEPLRRWRRGRGAGKRRERRAVRAPLAQPVRPVPP